MILKFLQAQHITFHWYDIIDIILISSKKREIGRKGRGGEDEVLVREREDFFVENISQFLVFVNMGNFNTTVNIHAFVWVRTW